MDSLHAIVAATLVVTSAFAQSPDQARLAEGLASGDITARRAIVERIKATPVADREPYLVDALLAELTRIRQELNERRLAYLGGRTLPPAGEENSEYLFSLLDVAAEHEDLSVLRPLLWFIGTGSRVMNAVASFGEDAVLETIAVARSNQIGDDPTAAVEVLRRMLERQTLRKPLSADSSLRIVTLARDLMQDGASVARLQAALRLAVTTGDGELIERVRQFAANDDVALQIGVVDEHQRRSLRATAQRSLQDRERR